MTQEETGPCLCHLVTILVHIIRHRSPSAVCFLPPPSLWMCMLLLPQGRMSPEGCVPLPACRPGLQPGDGGPGVQLVRQSAQRGGVPSQTGSGYTFHQPACLIFSSHPPTESRTQYIRLIYPVTLFRPRGSDSDVSVNANAAGVLVFQVWSTACVTRWTQPEWEGGTDWDAWWSVRSNWSPVTHSLTHKTSNRWWAFVWLVVGRWFEPCVLFLCVTGLSLNLYTFK